MSGVTSKGYPAERRERAVRTAGEVGSDYESEWAAMPKVAQLLGIGRPETVRKGCRRAEVDAGHPRYGYRRLQALMVREGYLVNHKRVQAVP